MKKITLKGEQTRHKIFDSAISLFKDKGYDNSSIREICNKAGITTGSFYHHFNSKTDILFEYVKYENDYIKEIVEKLENTSYFDNIITIIDLQYDFFINKGSEFLGNFISILLVDSKKSFFFESYTVKKLLLENIKKGIDCNEFASIYPAEYIADIIIQLLVGQITIWSGNRFLESRKNILELKGHVVILLNSTLKK